MLLPDKTPWWMRKAHWLGICSGWWKRPPAMVALPRQLWHKIRMKRFSVAVPWTIELSKLDGLTLVMLLALLTAECTD